MKKFSFSLQKILEIKVQTLDNLKIELGSLNKDLINMETAIKKFKKQFADIEREFLEKSSVSISVGEMYYFKMLMSSILKQIELKEEEKQILLKKIDSKRKEIINMNMEISSLEKLKDRELEKYNKEFEKNEELFIEEFVSNKSLTKGYAI